MRTDLERKTAASSQTLSMPRLRGIFVSVQARRLFVAYQIIRARYGAGLRAVK